MFPEFEERIAFSFIKFLQIEDVLVEGDRLLHIIHLDGDVIAPIHLHSHTHWRNINKVWLMKQTGKQSTAASFEQHTSEPDSFIKAFRGVRYQVRDVTRSIDFYTRRLGFKLDQQHLPAFAQVSVGNLQLILSGPGASGSRPMPDGHHQEPGGWNRIVLQVADLQDRIEVLKKAGLRFRNELEVGPGGKQIQLEDPDGNPIELFESAQSS